MAGIKLEGYERTIKAFANLQEHIVKRIGRKGLKAAGEPIAKAARGFVPKRTGALANAIQVISLRKDWHPGRIPVAVAPIFEDYKSGKYNLYYGRFVHDGTKDRKPTKKKFLAFNDGSGPGTAKGGNTVFIKTARGMKANPFMDRAFDVSSEESVRTMAETLSKQVDKYLAKRPKG